MSRVIALGFFDGVHMGHGALLKRTAEIGREKKLTPAAITFDVHPHNIISSESVRFITDAREREYLMGSMYGIEETIVLHFDEQLMKMPWEAFIDFLAEKYDAKHLVAGYDFRFGYRGAGNTDRLANRCRELGIGCDIIPVVVLEGRTVSSTLIRQLLEEGDVAAAARFMGHRYALTGEVIAGRQLGRKMGVPTVNLGYPESAVPLRFGVYASLIRFADGSVRKAVTNVGVRPTFGDAGEVYAESHLLDFSGDLYGESVCVEFVEFLRQEKRFNDTEALKCQINMDILKAKQILQDF